MISLHELNPKACNLNSEQDANIHILLERINLIRTAWGKPMTVTSGFRSLEDHKRIYMDLAKKRGTENIRIPMGSAHLKGCACDISDPDGKLYEWCQKNISKLEEAKLWCEEKDDQARVHFQIYPPASGKRFFKP